jgi:hypothetical protein
LPVRGAVAQAALADVGRLDDEMRRHREIAEQAFADRDVRMFRGGHLAKAPHRNVAETVWRGKELPVFQLVAEHRIGDVVGGEGEAVDLHQQGVGRQCIRIGKPGRDHLALLEIISRNDEVGRCHGCDPGSVRRHLIIHR